MSAYKHVKRQNSDNLHLIATAKSLAKCTYISTILFAAALGAICPILSFWKSGWAIQYFSPSEFSPQNSKLLLVSFIMMLSAQVILACVAITFLVSSTVLHRLNSATICLNIIQSPASIIFYVVLARVTGAEAGSLTYLLMLGVYQGIEMGGEGARMMFWVAAEEKGLATLENNVSDNDNKNCSLQWDEPNVEPQDDYSCSEE